MPNGYFDYRGREPLAPRAGESGYRPFLEEEAQRMADVEAVRQARQLYEEDRGRRTRVMPPAEYIGDPDLARATGARYSGEPGGELFTAGGRFDIRDLDRGAAYSPEREKFRFMEEVAALGPEAAQAEALQRAGLVEELAEMGRPTAGAAMSRLAEGGGRAGGLSPEELEALPPGIQRQALAPQKPPTQEEQEVMSMRARAQDQPTGDPFFDDISPTRARQWLEEGGYAGPAAGAAKPEAAPVTAEIEDLVWGPEWDWYRSLLGYPTKEEELGARGAPERAPAQRRRGGATVRRIR